MTLYESHDGRLRLFRGDSHRLHPITSGSVGVILTSPPYWVRGRGRPSAERYAHDLAVGFGREWKRVLAPDGDLWLVIGDRHDGAEWVGMDALVIGWLRRTGWRLQSRGFWAQTRSRERWDNRVNYLLRFRKVGQVVRPRGTTLCWMLPLPRSHPARLWDALPGPEVRGPRPRLTVMDRSFWVVLSRFWKSWRSSLQMVRPETVVGWHRQGFRRYWAWKSRRRCGRPGIEMERKSSTCSRPSWVKTSR